MIFIIHFLLLTLFHFTLGNDIYIQLSQQNLIPPGNGSLKFPYGNLTEALFASSALNITSNLTFILENDESSFIFFDESLLNFNLTIKSSSME